MTNSDDETRHKTAMDRVNNEVLDSSPYRGKDYHPDEAVSTSETLVNFHRATHQQLDTRRRKNMRSHINGSDRGLF
jgi:hypothetical protein